MILTTTRKDLARFLQFLKVAPSAAKPGRSGG